MDIYFARTQILFPQFNELALSDLHFWRTACLQRIIVKEQNLLIDGYYEKKKGKHIIVINIKLTGIVWLRTAFHELFHCLLSPEIEDGQRLMRSKMQVRDAHEKVIEALSLMAVMPFPELERLVGEDLTETPLLAEWLAERLGIVEVHRK